MEIYVGNEIELSMLKSAYGDLQYGTSTVALIHGPKGCGKSTLVHRMLAKAGLRDMEPYSGGIDGLCGTAGQESIVWLDDINGLSADELKKLSQICHSLGNGPKPAMIILTYTSVKDGIINAAFMSFVSGLETSLSGDSELLDIEMKPLKLADVHFLISKLYPENEFHSNFANQIHKASEGNPLMIHKILNRMEQDGNLTRQGNGKWLADNREDIITNIKSQIESSMQEREDTIKMPLAEKKYTADDIEPALYEAERLMKEYKMAQALEITNPLMEAAMDSQNAAYIYRAATDKCKILIYLGLYGKAVECAELSLKATPQENRVERALITALQAQAIGYESRFKDAFAMFDCALNIALACFSDHTAAQIYSLKLPFLLEYPLLDKVVDAYNRGIKHCVQPQTQRTMWELRLYYIYYMRYVSQIDEAMEESEKVLRYFRGEGDVKFEARTLNVIGLLYTSKCNFEKAGEYFIMAINLLKSVDDKVGLIGIFNNMGHLKFDTGNYIESIEYFDKAFAISSRINSRSMMLVSYTGKGSSYIYLGNNSEAEKNMLKAREIAQTMENKSSMAYVISALGDLYSHTGDNEKALEVYLQALDIDRELGDMPSVVCDLTNIANVYITTRDVDNGIKYLEGIKNEMPDYSENVGVRAAIENTFGNIYSEKGDTDKAMEHYNAALEINLKCGDHICTSLNYYNIGLLHIDNNDWDKAIECFENAVKYDRLSGDKMQLAQHLQRLAYCNRMIDEPEKSQQQNMEAVSLFRKLNLMDDCAISMRAAGDDARVTKIYPNAEKLLLESAEILSQTKNYLELADTYSTLGVLYTEIKKMKKAESYFRMALSLHTENKLGNYERYSKIAQSMAWMYSQAAKNDKAVEVFKELRENGGSEYYLENTLIIAKILEEMKNPDAGKYYLEAAALARDNDDVQLKTEILGEAGEYLSENGKADKGVSLINEAIELLDDIDDKLGKARMMVSLADAYENLNKLDEAIQTYQAAIQIFQELNEKWDVACAYNNIGYLYDTQYKCAYAAQYYHMAFEEYKNLDNRESMAKNLYNEALMNERMGNTQKSAQIYREVLNYIDEEENPAGYATTALNVAKCMSTYTDDDAVLKFTQKAYDIFQSIMQTDDMIACLEFMALFNHQKGNTQAAKANLSKLLAIKDMKRDNNTRILVYNSAASISFYMGALQDAVEYFQKTIAISTEMDSWRNIALCNLQMAAKISVDDDKYNLEINYNGKTRKVWEFSVECINFAIKIAESEKMTSTVCEACELLAQIYDNIGDAKNMLLAIEKGLYLTEDEEQRLNFMMRAAIAERKYMNNPEKAQDMMLDVASQAEEQNLWEIRILATIWLCYWRLLEFNQDEKAIQTLQNISQRYGYLLFKVPGLIEFLKRL